MVAQLSKSRIAYLEEVKQFSESKESVKVNPVRLDGSKVLGWTISKGGQTLVSSRGGSKIFRALSSVATYCEDNKIGSFEVVGL